MNKFSILVATAKALAERIGLRAPAVIQPPTEYQKFVAGKAKNLLELMDLGAQESDYMKDMVVGMRLFLEDVIACKINLPSRKLTEWTWYFIYENPERLDLKYPEICLAKADLSCAMLFSSFEKLHAWESRHPSMRK
jgi:hypothetical protein